MSDWTDTRKITTRLIICGDLELTTPAHLGSGEIVGSTDMPLLRDALDDRPLLTGTSLTGALRANLLARTKGYGQKEQRHDKDGQLSIIQLLLGGVKGDEEGDQSPLIVDDALAQPTVAEIRDGVRINPETRIAEDKFKYDGEFLPPGVRFPLRFELLLADDVYQEERLGMLVAALQALEQGEIAIGARKTRGFGRCRVVGWRMTRFDLRQPEDLFDWLTLDENTYPALTQAELQPITALILVHPKAHDQRQLFTIRAVFDLASPLLIRSEEPLTNDDHQPDVSHLRDGVGRPIISGTSLAGVLRGRAARILHTLGLKQDNPDSLLNKLFGKDMLQHKMNPTASRLIVEEAAILRPNYLVQNRVAIDRFTGGAFDTALFAEAPQVDGTVELRLSIRNPEDCQIGLLLLLLKDLWTSDLPLGGTSSIGRGRLAGKLATLTYQRGPTEETWNIRFSGDRLTIEGDRQKLEDFVQALCGGTHARD